MAEVSLRSAEPENEILIADVLICGICDSGKTTLLSQLISGKAVQTYTSMTHNKMTFPVENKDSVELVDVPGHERVRAQILDTFSGSARALVFMVDSNTVSKQIRDVAECLHSILSQKIISKNRFVVLSVSILILIFSVLTYKYFQSSPPHPLQQAGRRPGQGFRGCSEPAGEGDREGSDDEKQPAGRLRRRGQWRHLHWQGGESI